MNSVGTDTHYEIHSREEAEVAGGQIAGLTIQLNAAVAKQNRAEFAAQKHASAAQDLRQRMARYEEALKAWAQQNRAELLSESKTLELRHVTLSFKLSNPSVRLLAGWEPKAVVAKLWKSRQYRKWVRVKYELDRQRVLSDSRQLLGQVTAKLLKRFGLEIGQEEKFHVEPKLAQAA